MKTLLFLEFSRYEMKKQWYSIIVMDHCLSHGYEPLFLPLSVPLLETIVYTIACSITREHCLCHGYHFVTIMISHYGLNSEVIAWK